ncbi:MAG: 30S ribosomal protein S20 [Chloroflexi bacterium]|nr:MAG: 30S ribosomal protein S20 [Chloroflexota bacterium]
MANTKSAIKRLRSAERRRLRNRIHRGRARPAVKKARRLMDEVRLEEAREAVRMAVSALDKAAEKGIIHKNNAARRKSRLMQRLNQAERAV